MLIVNKIVITLIDAPTVVLFCQLLFASLTVFAASKAGVINEIDKVHFREVRPYFLVALAFLGALYTNIKALQFANVETFIVFRSSTPLLISFLDYVFLGRQLPDKRSIISLTFILLGAVVYVLTETSFDVRAYAWVTAWFVVFAIDQIYIKHVVVTVPLSSWGRVFYTNTMALIPVLIVGAVNRDDQQLLAVHWTLTRTVALCVSSIIGVLMSYSAFQLRALVSATSFTVIGTICKIATVIINCLIWDKHASLQGVGALLCCIFAGSFYRESPLRAPSRSTSCALRLNATRLTVSLGAALFSFFILFYRTSIVSREKLFGYKTPLAILSSEEVSAREYRRIHSGESFSFQVKWIGADPRNDGGKFLYYSSFAKAFSNRPEVDFCEELTTCLGSPNQDGDCLPARRILLAFSHADTTDITNLRAMKSKFYDVIESVRELREKVDPQICSVGKLDVIFFLNKAYRDLGKKAGLFSEMIDMANERLPDAVNVTSTIFTWSPHAQSWTMKFNMTFKHISFATDASMLGIGRNDSSCPDQALEGCDVFLHWDTNPAKYRLREKIQKTVTSSNFANETGLTVWAPSSFISQSKYHCALAKCKFHISTIGMPGEIDLVGTRYYEVLASGKAVLFAEREGPESISAYQTSGWVENRELVKFSCVDELIERLTFFKRHPEKAARIASAAMLWSANKTWDNVALDVVEGITQSLYQRSQ